MWLWILLLVLLRICEAGMLGMLVEIAVGLAALVQFGDAGTLVLE